MAADLLIPSGTEERQPSDLNLLTRDGSPLGSLERLAFHKVAEDEAVPVDLALGHLDGPVVREENERVSVGASPLVRVRREVRDDLSRERRVVERGRRWEGGRRGGEEPGRGGDGDVGDEPVQLLAVGEVRRVGDV